MLASQQIRRPLLVGLLASSAGLAAARVQTKTVTDDGDVVFSPEVAEEGNGLPSPKVADVAAPTPLSSSTVQLQDGSDKKDNEDDDNKNSKDEEHETKKHKKLTLTQEFAPPNQHYTPRKQLITSFSPPYRYLVPTALANAGQDAIGAYSKVLAALCKNETDTYYFVAKAMAEVYMVISRETSSVVDDVFWGSTGQFDRLFRTVHRFQNDDWKMFKNKGKHLHWYREFREPILDYCSSPIWGAMKAANDHVEAIYQDMSSFAKEIALEEMVSDAGWADVVPVHPNTSYTENINYIADPRKKAKAIRKTLTKFSRWYERLLELLFKTVKTRVAEELAGRVKSLPDKQRRVKEDSKMADVSAANNVAKLAELSETAAVSDKKRDERREEEDEKKKKEKKEEDEEEPWGGALQAALENEDYEDDGTHLIELYNDTTEEWRPSPRVCKVVNMQMYKLGRVMAVVQEMFSPDPEQNSAYSFLMHPPALKKVRELAKDQDEDNECHAGYHYSLGIQDAEKDFWMTTSGHLEKKYFEKLMKDTKLDVDGKELMEKMLGDGFKTLDTLIKHRLQVAANSAQGAQTCEQR